MQFSKNRSSQIIVVASHSVCWVLSWFVKWFLALNALPRTARRATKTMIYFIICNFLIIIITLSLLNYSHQALQSLGEMILCLIWSDISQQNISFLPYFFHLLVFWEISIIFRNLYSVSIFWQYFLQRGGCLIFRRNSVIPIWRSSCPTWVKFLITSNFSGTSGATFDVSE